MEPAQDGQTKQGKGYNESALYPEGGGSEFPLTVIKFLPYYTVVQCRNLYSNIKFQRQFIKFQR
jgi:hypothetical protein